MDYEGGDENGGVDWGYFDKILDLKNKYLPDYGEGETIATQTITAVSKLIYKWYNDGDVYDNSYHMKGWCNDLSPYANWLYKYAPITRDILDRIEDVTNDGEYENLLKDLSDTVITEEYLEATNRFEKKGSVYNADGPFEFEIYSDDEDDEDYFDEEEDEDENEEDDNEEEESK